MANITKLTDKERDKPWRVRIRRKGHKPLTKMFRTRAAAERWARQQEDSIETFDLPLTIEQLKNETLGQKEDPAKDIKDGILWRYIKTVTPTKGCAASEKIVLERFAERDICKLSLAAVSVTTKHAYDYVEMRLKEVWYPKGAKTGRPITPRTVRRELNSISHVFAIAKKKWGYENLRNPFEDIEIKGAMHRRKRRLAKGELVRLLEACKGCRGRNRVYVPLAICLAVETGMRLQEIFNLKGLDIDTERRRIEIRKSKTDHATGSAGRTIVLSYGAYGFLSLLAHHVSKHSSKDDLIAFFEGCIFYPLTKLAFKQTWHDVVKRAGIDDLHFHDLRREAGSRFDEAGLTKGEHDLMMGHNNRDMASLYINADLQSIQDKLDRYQLRGMTMGELRAWYEEQTKAGHLRPQNLPEALKGMKASYGPLAEAIVAFRDLQTDLPSSDEFEATNVVFLSAIKANQI